MSKAALVNHLTSEIISLREQYHAEVGSKRKPWPKSIKTRIVELNRVGLPMLKIAEAVEIPYQTIMNWRSQDRKTIDSRKNFHSLTVRNPTVTVRTSSEPQPVQIEKIQRPDPIVTVRTPDQFIIEVPSSMLVQILSELRSRK